jgi:hypothetical protein
LHLWRLVIAVVASKTFVIVDTLDENDENIKKKLSFSLTLVAPQVMIRRN